MENLQEIKVMCRLTYGKKTASGNVLPTSVPAAMSLDTETREFVFFGEKEEELLRVNPEQVEQLDLSASGLFSPKSQLLAVTEVDKDGSVLVFEAKEIRRKDLDSVTAMIDAFTENAYFRRGRMWVRNLSLPENTEETEKTEETEEAEETEENPEE